MPINITNDHIDDYCPLLTTVALGDEAEKRGGGLRNLGKHCHKCNGFRRATLVFLSAMQENGLASLTG